MIRIRIERKVSKPGDWCTGKLHGFPQFNLADFLLDQPIIKRVRKHRSVPEPIRFQSNTLPLTTPAGRNRRREKGGGWLEKEERGIFSPHRCYYHPCRYLDDCKKCSIMKMRFWQHGRQKVSCHNARLNQSTELAVFAEQRTSLVARKPIEAKTRTTLYIYRVFSRMARKV